jgi:uncharacterized protein
MSHTPHELADEFPEFVAKIGAMKQQNQHFARLVDQYHEINRTIHRAETQIEPVDDATEEGFRKQRLRLKDEIYSMLAA